MDEKEVRHFIDVLELIREAFREENAGWLKDLSNKTIHTASSDQDAGSITMAVIVYALSKLIERKENLKIKRWSDFKRKFDSFLSLAISALKQNNFAAYESHLERSRKAITSISVNLKPYIQEVLRKASINKASKIYEHGISMEQTAKLLGITQWELSEYSGQTKIPDEYAHSFSQKKRAQMALEFFS